MRLRRHVGAVGGIGGARSFAEGVFTLWSGGARAPPMAADGATRSVDAARCAGEGWKRKSGEAGLRRFRYYYNNCCCCC